MACRAIAFIAKGCRMQPWKETVVKKSTRRSRPRKAQIPFDGQRRLAKSNIASNIADKNILFSFKICCSLTKLAPPIRNDLQRTAHSGFYGPLSH